MMQVLVHDIVAGDVIARRGHERKVRCKAALPRRDHEDFRIYFEDGGMPLDARWNLKLEVVQRGDKKV